MSTSMTTELLSVWNNAFCGIWWIYISLFSTANGSSHVAWSAYQTRPTKVPFYPENLFTKINKFILSIQSLRVRQDLDNPKTSNHLLYQTRLIKWPLLSWEKFRRKPATILFDGSFASIPNSDKRFARQHCRRSSIRFSPDFNQFWYKSQSFGS